VCNPVAWVYAIGTVLTVAAGVQQAKSQKAAAEYQADVGKQNAELNDLRASQSATIGAIQEEQHRAKVRQMAGAQRAQFAANGIDLGSGVVQDIVGQTYTMGETDALTIRFNAMNEAWGYRTQAVNDRNGARFAKWSGQQQATGTYLSTAASVTSSGYGAAKDGVFSRPSSTAPKGYG